MREHTLPKPIKATVTEAAGELQQLNLNAAGIDIGSREHAVAVPPGRDPQPVQIFGTFTEDLQKIVSKTLAYAHRTLISPYSAYAEGLNADEPSTASRHP